MIVYPAYHSVLKNFCVAHVHDEVPFVWLPKPVIASNGLTDRLASNMQILVANNKIINCNTYPSHEVVSCHSTYLRIKDLETSFITTINLYL